MKVYRERFRSTCDLLVFCEEFIASQSVLGNYN